MNSYYVDLLPIIKGKYRGVDRPWNMDNVYTNKSNAERLSLIQLFQRYDEIILLDDLSRKITALLTLRDACSLRFSAYLEIDNFTC